MWIVEPWVKGDFVGPCDIRDQELRLRAKRRVYAVDRSEPTIGILLSDMSAFEGRGMRHQISVQSRVIAEFNDAFCLEGVDDATSGVGYSPGLDIFSHHQGQEAIRLDINIVR